MMEIQLKELIETIKSEGIKSGESQGAEIVSQAKDEAASIISNARVEAAEMIKKAKNEVAREQASGEDAIRQASRDLILNLRKEIENLFESLMQNKIKESLTGDLLKEAIVAVVKGLTDDSTDLALMVDSKQLAKIEKALSADLSAEIKKGLEIIPFDQIDAGFRVSMKDGSGFYDFSDKEIALVLSAYLNRRLADIISVQ